MTLLQQHQPAIVDRNGEGLSAIAHSQCVYVIDDDRSTRRSLTFALSTAGFTTRAFLSGQDFLDEAATLCAGCVLLDLRMPELDGIEVLKRLDNQFQRFPVVVITGHGDIESAVAVMRLGAKDFLEKPFRDEVLLQILARLFDQLPNDARADEARKNATARVAQLTPRERELLQALVAGLPNKIAADQLNISIRTIEMHRSNLMHRLGVSSFAAAIRLAVLADVHPEGGSVDL